MIMLAVKFGETEISKKYMTVGRGSTHAAREA